MAEVSGSDFLNGIFADRPQNQTQFITLIKLQTPPLLSAVKTENGKRVLDKDLADQIELEQNTFINKLKAISPDIQILFKYRMVLNGVSIVAPKSAEEKIMAISGIKIEKPQGFRRPSEVSIHDLVVKNIADGKTSVNFIGADKAHALGIRGQGMKIGVIDTGIDYTHSMLGGPGTEEAYKSVDASKPSSLFPNSKVVGGLDLVGDNYDSASQVFDRRVPHPDENPLDQMGHGSHVAGTIAGIGDGTETYSGVAPDASLYAIKVFGGGSTSDEVVIAALEYSADPNKDLDLADQLDVVNLSLGSQYGTNHMMYNEAVTNLSRGGTAVVASAGNEGVKNDYITGSPAAVDDALSVAASVDNMAHNWQFRASTIKLPSGELLKVEAIEGPASLSLDKATSDVVGGLVYIGLADADLSEDLKTQLKGKIAIIDRGGVTFLEKLKRAEDGGAIGAIVVNNQDGDAFAMGGDGPAVGIPAIMIRKDIGTKVKDAMKEGAVVATLRTNEKILKPELIDTLADFSSKGPRSIDGFLKPEISAPGSNIISVDVGTGNKGVKMSGTSMAGPHMTGAMALLKQKFPELSSEELKSVAMGTSVSIADKTKKTYLLSQQGAGRIQVDNALQASVISKPASISLGIVAIEKSKTLSRKLTLKNITSQPASVTLKFVGHEALSIAPVTVALDAKSEKTVELSFKISASQLKEAVTEVDGYVKVYQADKEIFKVATLAVAKKVSAISTKSLKVLAGTANEAEDAVVQVTLKNDSAQPGDVLLFNKIDVDSRKPAPQGSFMSKICDMEAAGYRIVGSKVQFAIKLYEPVTSWHLCEVSIQMDSNGDKEAEQELAGVPGERLKSPATAPIVDFRSILIDASKARDIRKSYEIQIGKTKDSKEEKAVTLDYAPSIMAMSKMKTYSNSTIAVVEVDRSDLMTRPSGELAVKITATAADDYNIESDDFLGSESEWRKIDVSDRAPSFRDMPESTTLAAGEETTLELTKGQRSDDLLVLMPQNPASLGTLQDDKQMELPKVSFEQ
jgi:subtilisin family serine protease